MNHYRYPASSKSAEERQFAARRKALNVTRAALIQEADDLLGQIRRKLVEIEDLNGEYRAIIAEAAASPNHPRLHTPDVPRGASHIRVSIFARERGSEWLYANISGALKG